jgi:hypothetical protein
MNKLSPKCNPPELQEQLDGLREGALFQISRRDYERLFGGQRCRCHTATQYRDVTRLRSNPRQRSNPVSQATRAPGRRHGAVLGAGSLRIFDARGCPSSTAAN